MPGSRCQEAEVEAPDDSTQPAARKGDAELLVKPLPQIGLTPAHHPMHSSDRPVLHAAHQGLKHGRRQAGHDTAAMMVPHAIRAFGIETHHPVPHDLPIRPGLPGHVPA